MGVQQFEQETTLVGAPAVTTPVKVSNVTETPNGTSTNAGAAFWGANGVKQGGVGSYGIQVCLQAGAATSTLSATWDGVNYGLLNGGTPLTAGVWYNFHFEVSANMPFNLKFASASTLLGMVITFAPVQA